MAARVSELLDDISLAVSPAGGGDSVVGELVGV